MGLFDFITKNSATNTSTTPQPVTQNAGQAYQANPTQDADRLVQTPFSDVKYPLPQNEQPADLTQMQTPITQPTAEPQLGTPTPQPSNVAPQLPSVAPQFAYSDNQTAGLPPLGQAASDTGLTPDQQNSGGTSFLQYNSQFENQTPSVPDLQMTAPELPTPNVAEVPEAMPTETAAQEAALPELTQATQPLPELPPLNTTDSSALPELPNNMSIQNNPVPALAGDASQIQAGLNAPLAEPAPEPSLAPSGNTVEDQLKDTLVIGTENNTNKEESYPEEKAEEPAETPVVAEPTEAPIVDSVAPVAEESKMPVDHIEGNKNEAELDGEIFDNISSEVKNEFEKSESNVTPASSEMPKTENTEEVQPQVDNSNEIEEEKPEAYKFKVFMNIGLVGLNVMKPNQQVTESLVEVVRSLASSKLNFILDSGKGYGETLLNKLVDYKDISIKGVYLKPFYSDYSDEPKVKLNMDNYSTAMFSNQDLKVRHLIKSSDVFIMPETDGISNISLLFSLLSNAYLYFGQHKPVILLGNNWTQMVSAWKSSMGFNQMESNLFNVCQTSKEVLDLLIKWDKEYTGKSKVSVHKVLDMRNESDESDYFVNNV